MIKIKTRSLLFVMLVSVSLLFLSGCGSNPGKEIVEKAIETQTGGKVDINSDKDQMNIKSKEGDFSMSGSGNATLHPDFPREIFITPDAKIMLSMANGQNKSYSVAYYTSMNLNEVIAKYKENLGGNGWTADEKTEIIAGDSKTILYKRGNQRLTLIIGLSNDKENAGKTYVQVIGAEDTPSGN